MRIGCGNGKHTDEALKRISEATKGKDNKNYHSL
ncbi:NUMOD3 domain-containing DNA-binding protein [Clostridium perfringens]|nr:hypothetical protein [Clostridium perfringens]MDK0980853.1 NUMOD3 domain-containing DNA-binding protein [Clostridium perfringens]MDU3019897.1 NUMOD3 domain-containing DNA-binding protein [Clostridium perfringens]